MTSEAGEARVLCIGAASPGRATALDALVHVLLPGAHVSHAAGPALPPGAPAPDLIVVDSVAPGEGTGDPTRDDGAASSAELEVVRRLRAGGFRGPIVTITDAAFGVEADVLSAEIARLGGIRTMESRAAAAVADALAAAVEARRDDGADAAALVGQVHRTRQLLAAGEVAIGLQHSLNNPLAAILAESQLLQMDALADDQREAVARIVALCRRMTAIVRRLDGVGGPGSRP